MNLKEKLQANLDSIKEIGKELTESEIKSTEKDGVKASEATLKAIDKNLDDADKTKDAEDTLKAKGNTEDKPKGGSISEEKSEDKKSEEKSEDKKSEDKKSEDKKSEEELEEAAKKYGEYTGEKYGKYLAEEYSKYLKEEFEKKSDEYLTYIAEDWKKENKIAIESSIKVELAEAIMSDLKALFEKHNLELPQSDISIVESYKESMVDTTSELDKAISNNMSLKEDVSKLEKEILTRDICKGMSMIEESKIRSLIENIEFDRNNYEEKLGKILSLTEETDDKKSDEDSKKDIKKTVSKESDEESETKDAEKEESKNINESAEAILKYL